MESSIRMLTGQVWLAVGPRTRSSQDQARLSVGKQVLLLFLSQRYELSLQ